MVHHAHGGNHSIQREDGVQYHNLRHDNPEAGIAFTVAVIMLTVFQPFMELGRGLEQQEQTAEQHDQITAGEAQFPYAEERTGERHHPGDQRQQTQTHHQRQG